jgi:hypothetical protein
MDGEVEYAQRPTSVKKLRACRHCKLIKTYEQVYTNFHSDKCCAAFVTNVPCCSFIPASVKTAHMRGRKKKLQADERIMY